MPDALILEGLFRYPVKSLKGHSLQATHVGQRGIVYDREWMLWNRQGKFMTQRRYPSMALIETAIISDRCLLLSQPGKGEVEVPLRRRQGPSMSVQVWDNQLLGIDEGLEASSWLSEVLDTDCCLVRFAHDQVRPPRKGEGSQLGFADGYPFLIVSGLSLEDLNHRIREGGGDPVPMDRFRPNLVVAGSAPYAEDEWRSVQIGEVIFAPQTTCVRCRITVTDQATAAIGKEPLRTLARYRNDRGRGGIIFGRNCNHLTQGSLRLGQAVLAR